MPFTSHVTTVLAIPAPPTPLGPWEGSAVSWTTWVTLMGFVGLTTLALAVVAPAARQAAPGALTPATMRLSKAAAVLGVLAVPAVLAELAYSVTSDGNYAYGAAWKSMYDGSPVGLWSGLEVTFSLVGAVLVVPVTFWPVAASRARTWFLGSGLAAGSVSLAMAKFPADATNGWDRTIFETGIWMLHLFGAAIWIGGLAGLLLIAAPGGVVEPADRGAFFSALIRRFSAVAMTCVGLITLSGLFLYWEHVDGPAQLVTTMYGRTLGVKLIIFGALLALGMANQFWLHPRVEALRAAGDQRPLRRILIERFPKVVASELLLAMLVLFIAPFLHSSARNQVFQASISQHITKPTPADQLPKLPEKPATASTWAYGSVETIAVAAVMLAGYAISGTILRNRRTAAITAHQAHVQQPSQPSWTYPAQRPMEDTGGVGLVGQHAMTAESLADSPGPPGIPTSAAELIKDLGKTRVADRKPLDEPAAWHWLSR